MAARKRFVMLVLVALVLGLVSACGGDDGDDGATDTTTTTGADPGDTEPDTSEPEGTDDAGSSGPLPEACDVFDPADLTAAFGDAGSATLDSIVPTRNVCSYSGGITVGVSEGDEYDSTVEITRENAECADVEDVGEQAIFCTTADGIGQLLWLDGGVMYDLTAGATDQAVYVDVAGKVKI